MLVASIADAAPESILHNVMPVFTFMGAGMMQNSDDYSVYVVKKVGLNLHDQCFVLTRQCR